MLGLVVSHALSRRRCPSRRASDAPCHCCDSFSRGGTAEGDLSFSPHGPSCSSPFVAQAQAGSCGVAIHPDLKTSGSLLHADESYAVVFPPVWSVDAIPSLHGQDLLHQVRNCLLHTCWATRGAAALLGEV